MVELDIEFAQGRTSVRIADGLLSTVGRSLAGAGLGGRVLVVTDEHVRPLYADRTIRSLEEAGLTTALLSAPDLEAVKAAHGLGVTAVELFTGTTVDLPAFQRRAEKRWARKARNLLSNLPKPKLLSKDK